MIKKYIVFGYNFKNDECTVFSFNLTEDESKDVHSRLVADKIPAFRKEQPEGRDMTVNQAINHISNYITKLKGDYAKRNNLKTQL